LKFFTVFKNLPIKTKLIIIAIFFISLSIVSTLTFISLKIYFKNMDDIEKFKNDEMTDIRKTLKNYVGIAYKIIEKNYQESINENYIKNKYEKITDNEKNLALFEAKENTKKTIKIMIYDNGKGYFWINDTTEPYPKMIMHPIIPELNGKILDDKKYNCAGKNNQNLFQAFLDVCKKNNEGFVTYMWPEPKEDGITTEDKPKESYVKLFKEWGWIIGTGVYTDHIDKKIEQKKRESNEQIFKIIIINIIIAIIITIINIVVIIIFVAKVLKPFQWMRSIVKEVTNGDITKNIEIKSNDEVGELSKNFNYLINNFRQLLSEIKKSIMILTDSIQNLSVTSKEISTTSNQQAASIKEIVSTMEDSEKLSKSISAEINEVAKISNLTKDFVDKGFKYINKNLLQMDKIKKSNSQNIIGIKDLDDKIENIWEIVKIINDIADQTKIIAFNAELEATAAGEAGKNFQIVAGEIRRLADNIVYSTNEIKNMITEIQHSSNNLIDETENGTLKIKEGWQISIRLKELFKNILTSSEESAKSADHIASNINQQASSFEQILLTLKQISAGIDNFSLSIKSTAKTSEVINNMAEELNNIIIKYKVK